MWFSNACIHKQLEWQREIRERYYHLFVAGVCPWASGARAARPGASRHRADDDASDGVGTGAAFRGSARSLPLAFRTNTAYSRWNEARTLWGGLINNCRNVVRQGNTFFPDDAYHNDLKRRPAAETTSFIKCLRNFLRGPTDDEPRRSLASYVLGVLEMLRSVLPTSFDASLQPLPWRAPPMPTGRYYAAAAAGEGLGDGGRADRKGGLRPGRGTARRCRGRGIGR